MPDTTLDVLRDALDADQGRRPVRHHRCCVAELLLAELVVAEQLPYADPTDPLRQYLLEVVRMESEWVRLAPDTRMLDRLGHHACGSIHPLAEIQVLGQAFALAQTVLSVPAQPAYGPPTTRFERGVLGHAPAPADRALPGAVHAAVHAVRAAVELRRARRTDRVAWIGEHLERPMSEDLRRVLRDVLVADNRWLHAIAGVPVPALTDGADA